VAYVPAATSPIASTNGITMRPFDVG
jgi:hypothetical protein